MKTVKGITVELINKRLNYSGVDLEYDFVKKSATTGIFSSIAIASDYNAPLFCPDRAIVIESDDPKILVGDIVILDYYVVARKLGGSIEEFQDHPNAMFEIVDGKVIIPVKTIRSGEQYVYAIFREGQFVEYNGFQIITPIKEKITDKIYAVRFDKVSQKYVETQAENHCTVLYGEYAGMTCVFRPEYLLGEAQHSLINGVEVRFIQKEYLLAEVEEVG